MAVDLSIIIPAHNEADCIETTVRQAIEAGESTGRSFEIIVSCDACTDDTAALARDAGARTIDVCHRQIAATRNSGAKEATGEFLFFLDADTHLPELTLQAAIDELDAGAVGGGAMVVFDSDLSLIDEYFIFMVQWSMRLFRFTGGCFLFCRRQAFDATDGFDERYFASEEVWMCSALKKQGRFALLPQFIETSGRKLERYSAVYLMWKMFMLSLRGLKSLQRREGLDIWYKWRQEAENS